MLNCEFHDQKTGCGTQTNGVAVPQGDGRVLDAGPARVARRLDDVLGHVRARDEHGAIGRAQALHVPVAVLGKDAYVAARDVAVDIGDGAGARGERADHGAALALVERVQRRLGGVTHDADKSQALGMLDLGLDGGGKALAHAELGSGEVPAHLIGDQRLGHLYGGLRVAQAAAGHKQRDERQGAVGLVANVLTILFVLWVACVVAMIAGVVIKFLKKQDVVLFASLGASAVLSLVCIIGALVANGQIDGALTQMLASNGGSSAFAAITSIKPFLAPAYGAVLTLIFSIAGLVSAFVLKED